MADVNECKNNLPSAVFHLPSVLEGLPMTLEPLLSLADRSDRVRLRITGPDRVKFLNNLTTNDVKRLAVGQGCEAFVTSLQGKTIGYVTLLAANDELLLRSDAGALEGLLSHFQKYAVFDDVAWEDVSASTCELHLIGSNCVDLLARLGLPEPAQGVLDHEAARLDALPVQVVREAPTGRPGVTLLGPVALADRVRSSGRAIGLVDLDPATFDALRIEAGTPVFGRDITPGNLPQELGRDRQAISFAKGCYLGQETVARLDALGHVNRLLKGLRLDRPAPAGTELKTAEGQVAGALTSVVLDPDHSQPIALGFVRRPHARPGQSLAFDAQGQRGVAQVCDFPMRRPWNEWWDAQDMARSVASEDAWLIRLQARSASECILSLGLHFLGLPRNALAGASGLQDRCPTPS